MYNNNLIASGESKEYIKIINLFIYYIQIILQL